MIDFVSVHIRAILNVRRYTHRVNMSMHRREQRRIEENAFIVSARRVTFFLLFGHERDGDRVAVGK